MENQTNQLTPNPHSALILEWAQLWASGEVEQAWWTVEETEPMRNTFTTSKPMWKHENSYKIVKTGLHPDNCKPKPKLKLIDWEKMHVGTAVKWQGNHAEIVGLFSDGAIVYLKTRQASYAAKHKDLRLAEQEKFTYWGGGTCPVPDGVIVEVVDRWSYASTGVGKAFEWRHLHSASDATGYRVIGLADGYTDDPSKAGE